MSVPPSCEPDRGGNGLAPVWIRRRALTLGSFVWLAVMLIDPALDVGNQHSPYVAGLLLIAIAAAAVGAVVSSTYCWRPVRYTTGVCVSAIVSLTVTTSIAYGAHWLTLWLLLAIIGAAVTGARLAPFMVVTVALAAGGAAWLVHGTWDAVWVQALTTFLAGGGTAVFARLNETIAELNRTREELAERAVLDERQRFSRDLHDLLGHTLSVIVVKSEAVRRLVHRDPDGAAQHAQDIESIGRRALGEVRDAVDGYRGTTLAAETERAGDALEAAGIAAEILPPSGVLPAAADETLAWVVREGVTNVIRHSGAAHCRIEVRGSSEAAVLELSDDGPGTAVPGRGGGIDGLRERVALANGELQTRSLSPGFALTATIPGGGQEAGE